MSYDLLTVVEFTFSFFPESRGDICSTGDLLFFAKRALWDYTIQRFCATLVCCRSAQGLQSSKGSRVLGAVKLHAACPLGFLLYRKDFSMPAMTSF